MIAYKKEKKTIQLYIQVYEKDSQNVENFNVLRRAWKRLRLLKFSSRLYFARSNIEWAYFSASLNGFWQNPRENNEISKPIIVCRIQVN